MKGIKKMWLGFEAKGTVEDMRKAFNDLKAKAQDVLILDVVRDISPNIIKVRFLVDRGEDKPKKARKKDAD